MFPVFQGRAVVKSPSLGKCPGNETKKDAEDEHGHNRAKAKKRPSYVPLGRRHIHEGYLTGYGCILPSPYPVSLKEEKEEGGQQQYRSEHCGSGHVSPAAHPGPRLRGKDDEISRDHDRVTEIRQDVYRYEEGCPGHAGSGQRKCNGAKELPSRCAEVSSGIFQARGYGLKYPFHDESGHGEKGDGFRQP